MTYSRSKGNPFSQSPQYWKAVFVLPEVAAEEAHNSFDDIALSISAFETDEAKNIWTFEILCAAEPDMKEIEQRLMVLGGMYAIPAPKPVLHKIEQQDWLKAVAKSFPPLTIGRFYVHGAHSSAALAHGMIPIQVDAGAAFGSGEHGTTRCCLEALNWLAKSRSVRNVLDMGCGSGILAIAAAKLWKVPVLAADIDAVAVAVTEENCRINRVPALVEAVVSDGYSNERIGRAKPYDLIISNILARPLVKFAPDLKANLAQGGFAVLSGLLVSQESQVRSAHMAQGLTLFKRFVHGEWCTLVLK
jgi:ribosomal protein L11 methyltransferase